MTGLSPLPPMPSLSVRPKRRPMPPWPLVIGLVAVTVTVGYPLAMLFLQSVFPRLSHGSLSGFLAPYVQMARMSGLAPMWVNSFVSGAIATAGAWVLGIPAGWVLARTAIPGRTALRVSMLVPVMCPPYLLALAYVLMVQPHGLLDSWGMTVPPWLRQGFFSLAGVSLVMTLTQFGQVALLVETALFGISTRMDDAALCLGSGPWKTFRTITLPLLLPAILNAGILVFIDAVSNFGIAAILAPRAHLPLLPDKIYGLLNSWPSNIPLAASMSTVLALMALGLVAVSQKVLAGQALASARVPATRQMRINAGQGILIWLYFAVLFLFSSVLPVVAVTYMSFVKRWQGGHPLFTLENYAALFREGSQGLDALCTSLLLSLAAATLCVVIGALVAYTLARYRGWLVAFLDQLSVFPRIVPSLVVAVAMILAWNVPWIPLPIYGTVAVLLLAYVAHYQTTALRLADAGMRQISPKLEHASACLGISPRLTLRAIVFPMLRPSLFVAWITILIMCLRDWVVSIMLLPPGVATVGSFIFNQFEQGDFSQAMAMTTCTVVLSTVLLVAANLNFYRRILS